MPVMNAYAYASHMRQQAQTAFEHHLISRRSEGRWLLQRPHKDRWDDPKDRWDWTMAAEIICLAGGGSLYVGGDIRHVVFAHGPSDPLARVRWIGGTTDVGYYVHQKAAIGMGNVGVDVYNRDVAEARLLEMVTELLGSDEDVEEVGPVIDVIRNAIRDGAHHYDGGQLWTALREGADAVGRPYHFEEFEDYGRVVDPRVYFAHAAVERLCLLLDAEEDSSA